MSLSLPKNSICGIVQARENITDHNAISNRIKGFEDYLKEHEISITTKALKIDLYDKESDRKKIKAFLQSSDHITGIYIPSSRASYIASLLPDNINSKKVTLLGYDTTEDNIHYLKNGKIHFLISQRSFNQGYESVRMMSDYLIQKKTPEKKIFSPIQIIIKENVDFDSRYKKSFAKEVANNPV
jgi:LacI family transcriptional regulator